jgi:MSHA biogenesis protein MshG
MLNYWYVLIIICVVFYGAIRHVLNTPVGAMFWAEKKLKIPLVGKIIKKSALANFCQSFAMMYRSGISMLDILSIVSSTFNNVFLTSRIIELRGFIEQGDELTTAVEKINLFPPLVVQMFRVGDQTGEIDALLDEVAGMYEREIEYDVKKLGESIEPLLIAVMACAVAVLALGIFVPMWDMAGAMKGG